MKNIENETSYDNMLSNYYKGNIIKYLGVISFFNEINRNNQEIVSQLKDNFNIDIDDLFEKLNNLEELSVTENKIKFDNKMLSAYIFYLTFIKEHSIFDLSEWLVIFYENSGKGVSNNISFLTVNYLSEYLCKNIKQSSYDYFKSISNDENKLIHFYYTFYCYYDIEILEYVSNWKNNLSQEYSDIEKISIDPKFKNFNESIQLKLLSELYTTNYFKKALDISIEIIKKQPLMISEISHNINKQYLNCIRKDRTDSEYPELIKKYLNNPKSQRESIIYNKLFYELSLIE